MTNPTYDSTGRVALVTGAASGMGLATAQVFAEGGAAVVLADLNADAVDQAAQSLVDAGHRAIGIACDVADEAQAAAAVDMAVETYGRLDMAFNCAGVQAPPSDAADETAENFDRVNAVNLRGVWAAQKHELRQMRAQGSGAIVNCSSLGGLVGLPERAAYHASEHGVIGLTKSAAVEYAPRGIRINVVCPGVDETSMVAGMLEGQAEAMAEIIRQQPIGRLGRARPEWVERRRSGGAAGWSFLGRPVYVRCGSEAQVTRDGDFHLLELVAMEEVGGVTADEPNVDAPELVDEETGGNAAQLDLGPENGRLCLRRRRNDGGDVPGHVGRAQNQAVAPPPLLMPATGLTEVDPIDGAANHQASASLARSSSASRSASSRARASHASRSRRRSARRMTSAVRSSSRIASRRIRSSSSVGRNPMVLLTGQC